MNITCLITTYNLNENQVNSLLSKMNIFCPSILRNQTTFSSKYEKIINGHNVQIINATDKGLSKNRNELLKLATSEFVIFSDDDQIFEKNILETISKDFSENKCDAFVYNYYVINKKRLYKAYDGKTKKCSKKSIMSTGIPRFVFKTATLKNINFDEKIGSGTKFLCGEDSVFIHDYIQKNNNVLISSKYITTINQTHSMWRDKIYSDDYFYSRGYVYKKIYPHTYPLAIIRFLLKTRHLTFKNLLKTINGYKKVINYYQ